MNVTWPCVYDCDIIYLNIKVKIYHPSTEQGISSSSSSSESSGNQICLGVAVA